MKCPTGCNEPLVMADRSGIEIDYCPTCRGVWLDRGELDKIIDRNATPAHQAATPRPDNGPSPSRYDSDRYDDRDRDDGRGRKAKRGGFLGELFEF